MLNESLLVEEEASPRGISRPSSQPPRTPWRRMISNLDELDYTQLLPLNLSTRLSLHTYWISLVTRLGFDRSVYQADQMPSLDVLSRYFDTTQLGLLRVFHLFDKDLDNNLSLDEIIRGLKQQGMYNLHGSPSADDAFRELSLLLTTETPNNSVVRAPEFLAVLKNLRLAAVLASPRLDLRLFYHEYREDFLIAHCPVEQPTQFLFRQTQGEDPGVRWVHVHEPSRHEILALSMKYALDPRFSNDLFTLWREQAKLDKVTKYEGRSLDIEDVTGGLLQHAPAWLMVIIPVLRLTSASQASLRPYLEWRRVKLKRGKEVAMEPPDVDLVVEHCNLAMIVNGESTNGTIVSFSSDWVTLLKSSTTTKPAADDGSVTSPGEMPELAVFSKSMLSQLRTSYSRLRTGGAQTFLLKALSDVTDDYVQVTEAFDAVLAVLQKRMDKEKDKMNHKDVNRLQKAVVQLSSLYRLVRPVGSILESFSRSGEALLFVSDTKSNVHRFLDDLAALKENAKMLVERYHNYCNSKTSSVLYALTLVTTVFVPGQFLTGLYGMNFIDPETGKPGMPELIMKHGYLFFWIVNILITGLTFLYYRRQHWI
jgi:Mg2+ and Co2+ transporter CorA